MGRSVESDDGVTRVVVITDDDGLVVGREVTDLSAAVDDQQHQEVTVPVEVIDQALTRLASATTVSGIKGVLAEFFAGLKAG